MAIQQISGEFSGNSFVRDMVFEKMALDTALPLPMGGYCDHSEHVFELAETRRLAAESRQRAEARRQAAIAKGQKVSDASDDVIELPADIRPGKADLIYPVAGKYVVTNLCEEHYTERVNKLNEKIRKLNKAARRANLHVVR